VLIFSPSEEEKRKGKGKEEKLCTYCMTEQAPSLLLERAMPLKSSSLYEEVPSQKRFLVVRRYLERELD
jgi:hypothetical protein